MSAERVAATFPPERFELLGRIGRGGMGEVWLARHRHDSGVEKLVALKHLLPEFAEEQALLELFIDEARVSARLSHPNVVQVFEFARTRDSAFFAMEFVHGVAVDQFYRAIVARRQDFPLAAVARIGAAVAAGLHHAHQLEDLDGQPLGVVHRDISPQNILVSFGGVIKLVDFGIAKATTQSHRTRTGTLRGKLQYMSPEQTRGEKLDGRSDVFALGTVLYELVAGVSPFARSSDPEILRAIDACEVPALAGRRPGVSPDLEAAILKALRRSPQDRYPDARAMQAALEQAERACLDRDTSELHTLLGELFPDRVNLGDWVKTLRKPPLSGQTRTAADVPGRPRSRTTVNEMPAHRQRTRSLEGSERRVKTARGARILPGLILGAGGVGLLAGGLWVGRSSLWAIAQDPAPAPALRSPDAAPAALVPRTPEPPARQIEPSIPEVKTSARVVDRPHQRPAERPVRTPVVSRGPSEASQESGYVTFQAMPWAYVELDGKRIGMTPLSGQKVVEGAHRVRFVNPGADIDESSAFHLRAGEHRVVMGPRRGGPQRDAGVADRP